MPKISALPAKAEADPADDLVIVDSVDGVTKKVPQSGVSPAGVDQLVFEWNGLDVSQFDTSNIWYDQTDVAIDDVTLDTFESGREARFRRQLRYTQNGLNGGGAGFCVILANDPLPSHNVRFELDVEEPGVNTFGLCVFAEFPNGGDIQSDFSGFCFSLRGNAQWRVDLGSKAGSGSFAQGPLMQSATGRHKCIVDMHAGKAAASSESLKPSGVVTGISYRPNTFPLSTGIGFQDFPADPPPDNPWQSIDALKWGLCWSIPGGVVGGPTRISGLRIYDRGTLL